MNINQKIALHKLRLCMLLCEFSELTEAERVRFYGMVEELFNYLKVVKRRANARWN
jgi:hypothetical protein